MRGGRCRQGRAEEGARTRVTLSLHGRGMLPATFSTRFLPMRIHLFPAPYPHAQAAIDARMRKGQVTSFLRGTGGGHLPACTLGLPLKWGVWGGALLADRVLHAVPTWRGCRPP